MRVPLSWLRDFAPFEPDAALVAATLDDLGLVVEETELVGEGIVDVIIARVDVIDRIEGADRIRRVVVDDGNGKVEVVCGAWNFEVGDLVPLAPVGAVLPGGMTIGRRKMKGVTSNGMLCSGRELGLSDDGEGILRLNDVEGAAAGRMLTAALGIEPDVVFEVAVEANRPDAWSIAGVARDLAARLGLPFSVPPTSSVGGVGPAPGQAANAAGSEPPTGPAIGTLASIRVEDTELCPRFTARVVTGVQVAASPPELARRLALAGMRPINNVVDASNYVMLELGQPTHPYDLDQLAGRGLVIRRARPGETITTLDGIERTLGRPGPGLGDTGQDCLICDAEGSPVGIGGVMGGASSEIHDSTSTVLLEAAYFVPMAVARTSKRLALRTEASARFERGCDPAGIDRAAVRFCELLALTAGSAAMVASGAIDIEGDVPRPVRMPVRPERINALLGTRFDGEEIAGLLRPLGIGVEAVPTGANDAVGGSQLAVTVPTHRPDIRPAPMGEADIAEEVARTFGYARLPRRMPSWPQPGRLTAFQRDRRLLKDVLCGLGASEAWTATFVTELDQILSGEDAPWVTVTNPLVDSERFLRSSMAPGLIRAVVHNTERRQGDVRLFEVGTTFHAPGDRPGDRGEDRGVGSQDGPPRPEGSPTARTAERLSAIFASRDDDAWTMVGAWRTIAEALGIAGWRMVDRPPGDGTVSHVLHPYRSAALAGIAPTPSPEAGELGVVGELDPSLVERLGLVDARGRPRRVGWMDLDIGRLLDRARVPRRPEAARPISRYPSSDIDLAFAVDESVPAGSVERTLQGAGGAELESVELVDVYRGPPIGDGSRSLAFRLRFCALDRTLTDEEIGARRSSCIEAVEGMHQASLR